MTASTFPEIVRRIFRQQTTAFKINLSFGFILRNVETGELRYYHSSQNNSGFVDVPHLIRTEEDLERFLEELSRHDMLEYIRQQRPDTIWVVHLLTNVAFYVNKINTHPVGGGVLLTKQSGSGTNRGFRVIDNKMYTYLQERAGFSYVYPKRKVLDDGVSTEPLDI
jgi:hypothetical protein